MSLAENRHDLRRHAEDFAGRTGFTYTVLETGTGAVIGCVYIYPSDGDVDGVDVRSWVRADRAALDEPLYREVLRWLSADWPLGSFRYAAR